HCDAGARRGRVGQDGVARGLPRRRRRPEAALTSTSAAPMVWSGRPRVSHVIEQPFGYIWRVAPARAGNCRWHPVAFWRRQRQTHDPSRGHPMAANDREKALETALAQIERQFGKGSVMRLGDEARAPIEVIPTGSIALDVALGIGGFPRGRIVEVFGPESSGKTTVALHAVANAQKAGGVAAYIDAEHALD